MIPVLVVLLPVYFAIMLNSMICDRLKIDCLRPMNQAFVYRFTYKIPYGSGLRY